MRLTAEDHARVTAAVAAAEADTAGEIVTVVARRSDKYHDVAAHWSLLAVLLVLAILSGWPALAERIHAAYADAWTQTASPSALFTIALLLCTLAFLGARLLLASSAVRLALTPGATKARRVRARALDLFRASAEQRTVGRTGVLLYLSLDERRAELIADEAIHSKVTPDTWGAAMAALIEAVRDGRPGDGLAAAIERIGAVLAPHFPRAENDVNELPDRLIEL